MSKKIIIEEEKIFDENGDITINAEVKIDEFIAFICDYCQNNNISPTILDLSCIEILKRNIFALKIIVILN